MLAAEVAAAPAVLVAKGRLLFGGHPTITPLVLMVASELDIEAAVDVFQSQWFEHQTLLPAGGSLNTERWRQEPVFSARKARIRRYWSSLTSLPMKPWP